jgi:hypothetical protein
VEAEIGPGPQGLLGGNTTPVRPLRMGAFYSEASMIRPDGFSRVTARLDANAHGEASARRPGSP